MIPILKYGLKIKNEKKYKDACTFTYTGYKDKVKTVEGFVDEGEFLQVPRSFTQYFPEYMDERQPGRKINPGKSINLRDNQKPFVDACYKDIINTTSSIGIAPCGTGKTIMSIEMAKRLGVSTCVLVHKSFLMNQWKERIKEFWPEAKVGICQQNKCNNGNDYDIVIAMVQSITRRKYEDFFDTFGLVISDECHRIGSKTFSQALFKFSTKYWFAVTATLDRQDGMEELLTTCLGKPSYVIEGQPTIPIIYVRKLDINPPIKQVSKYGEIFWPYLINWLSELEERNDKIAKDIRGAYKAGRKVLVITDRLNQIDILTNKLKEYNITDIDNYIGGRKENELEKAAEKSIIFATYGMASEGLDIPDLDVLVIATPRKEIIQAVGRILRQLDGKPSPVVIDRLDEFPILEGLFLARQKKYREKGYMLSKI